eukprot:1775605-Amphidinium_carterae.2
MGDPRKLRGMSHTALASSVRTSGQSSHYGTTCQTTAATVQYHQQQKLLSLLDVCRLHAQATTDKKLSPQITRYIS